MTNNTRQKANAIYEKYLNIEAPINHRVDMLTQELNNLGLNEAEILKYLNNLREDKDLSNDNNSNLSNDNNSRTSKKQNNSLDLLEDLAGAAFGPQGKVAAKLLKSAKVAYDHYHSDDDVEVTGHDSNNHSEE